MLPPVYIVELTFLIVLHGRQCVLFLGTSK